MLTIWDVEYSACRPNNVIITVYTSFICNQITRLPHSARIVIRIFVTCIHFFSSSEKIDMYAFYLFCINEHIIVVYGKVFSIVLNAMDFLPHAGSDKIVFSKD